MFQTPKSEVVLSEIESLFRQRKPAKSTLRRLRQDSLDLLPLGVEQEYINAFVGMIAALEYDVPEFFEQFRLSHLRMRVAFIEYDYAQLCRRLGFPKEAYETYILLIEENLGDVDASKGILAVSIDRIALEDALDSAHNLTRFMRVDLEQHETDAIDRLKFLAARLASLGIAQSAVLERIEAGAAVLRAAKEPIFGVELGVGVDDRMSYAFKLRARPDEVASLSSAIAKSKANNIDDMRTQLLTITCVVDQEAVPAS